MTASNLMRLSGIRETTVGALPATPRMRTGRLTGEGLAYAPNFVQSNELRADRMNADPIKVNETNQGAINFELSLWGDQTLGSELMRSAFYNPWTVQPYRDNDGTADSVVTDVNAGTQVVTVTAVAPANGAFVLGHVVRFTGFTNAANNGKFRVSTGSSTVPAFVGSGLVAEGAPPATARMKVVAFQGVAGDITATASGLASTTLDFTTLGITVGQWLKPGDADNAAFGFATAANNDFIRVTAVSANAITCDNLPTGWAVDAGAAKTIRVFFGDVVKNGTTRTSLSIERSFLGQAVPTHILQKGMHSGAFNLDITSEQVITGSFDMVGMSGSQGTVANGTSYDAATVNKIMAANVHVGRIAEGGSLVTSPAWAQSLQLKMENNLRALTAVGTVGAVDVQPGDCTVTGTLSAYFGSNALLTKLLAGTASNVNSRATIANVAGNGFEGYVLGLPRVIFTGGSPSAAGKNQDVVIPLAFQASIDTTTNAQFICDRFEYYN